MALSRFVVTADVTVPWPGTWSEITGGEANTPVTAPAVPSSTVAADNATGVTVAVTVTGGTVTVIAVNGTATGLTSGTVIVPYPGTITLTYSAAPTWAWSPAELPQSGAGGTAGVSGTAPPAGQSGTIPQYTFISGTAIYADSSGGTNGACQLYNAIGAGNLRAFVDGQDDVGHAALSN
jgi:hypothetical protein